ncbi:MAG: hypothetical protein Q8P24_00945 [Desulfobacterales bacterium]|nr:hypothetical protein [Desulfobacterales bacterium]
MRKKDMETMIDDRNSWRSSTDAKLFDKTGCLPLLGYDDLKETILVTEEQVACPVRGCPEKVRRQRGFFTCQNQYRCPRHHLCISPSTFQYPSEAHNILDRSSAELSLLENVKRSKRESRIARDNSEDALSWNVFRHLQRSVVLHLWIKSMSLYEREKIQDVVFWSHSLSAGRQWGLLNDARITFGEDIKRGSEPDIVIVTDRCIYFVEAKLTATNKTSGNGETLARRLANPKEYVTANDGWFSEIFTSDYITLVKDQKYELMRLWLLGNWSAKISGKDFVLINLVCAGNEAGIEAEFGHHIRKNKGRRFVRKTWEDIHGLGAADKSSSEYRRAFLRYLEFKTTGYASDGQLRRAFKI